MARCGFDDLTEVYVPKQHEYMHCKTQAAAQLFIDTSTAVRTEDYSLKAVDA